MKGRLQEILICCTHCVVLSRSGVFPSVYQASQVTPNRDGKQADKPVRYGVPERYRAVSSSLVIIPGDSKVPVPPFPNTQTDKIVDLPSPCREVGSLDGPWPTSSAALRVAPRRRTTEAATDCRQIHKLVPCIGDCIQTPPIVSVFPLSSLHSALRLWHRPNQTHPRRVRWG